jgi:hypothetical protein
LPAVVIRFEDSGAARHASDGPVCGTVEIAGERSTAQRFDGWLQLLGMLEALSAGLVCPPRDHDGPLGTSEGELS